MTSKAETATFAVALNDETSGPARSAADALADLQAKLDAGQRALREMNKAQRALKGGTVTNVSAMRELKDRIAAQKATIAAAQAEYIRLGGTFGDTKKAAQDAAGGFDELFALADRLPGPIGSLVGRLSSLRSLIVGAGLVTGILAIAAALVALVSAVGAATGALLRYGIAQSDAARSELLRLEGLTTIRRWYGLAGGSASELQAAIDRVSDSTGVGRGQLERYTAQLHRMGLRGESLSQALEGMSIVGAVQGDQWARRFAGMAAGAARSGRSVRALADDVRARLGGLARRHMLSLDNQAARLRANLARMFGGLRIEGFLSALNEMTTLFSQSSASGRALKSALEAILQPLIDGFGRLAPVARRFFQGLAIGAALLAIGLVRVRRNFERVFGDTTLIRGVDAMRLALYAGVAAAALLGATVTFALGVLGGIVGVLAGPTAALVLLYGRIREAADWFGRLVDRGREALAWLTSADWASVGASLADGLVAGLSAGTARVVAGVQDLAARARGAFEEAMGIASPSRVFRELGLQLSRGVVVGVDEGAPAVEGAVAGVVNPPAAGGAARGAGVTVSIGDIHIHTSGGDQESARTMAQELVDELVSLLEGSGIDSGAPA